jgi:hypothetical protein
MALSRDKAIVIGVVVLGGLSALVYRQAKHDEQLGSAAKADLPDLKATDDVDKIELTNGDKPTVTLEKQGDTWQMTTPGKYPASQTNVKSLLDNLKGLKAKEVVANNADDAMKTTYNLDPAHALHLVAYKGADKKEDFLFGKTGGRGDMMMVTGKPEILAASGYSSFLYSRDAKDWRNHDIFKFEDKTAASIAIDNKNGKLSCTNGDKWACTWNGQPIPSFDESAPTTLTGAFKYLVAMDFPADDKTPETTGLAPKPAATVTIALKDGAGTYTLKVGDESSGGAHYAMKDGDPVIYIINSNASDWANAKEEKLEKAADAGAPKTASAKKP